MSRAHRPHRPSNVASSGTVVVTRLGVNVLEPDLRRAAMRLAGGDALRVQVISTTEAIIR